jgi:hypothetical protein
MEEISFLKLALDARRSWDTDEVRRLSQLVVPERILGDRRKSILRSDIRILWATWFIESLVDPRRYVPNEKTYTHLLYDALCQIQHTFSHLTKAESMELATEISAEVWERVSGLRLNAERAQIARDMRFDLLAEAGESPRCWMCGHLFSNDAVKAFEEGKQPNWGVYEFLDVYKPMGLRAVDFSIQVDHVDAWSHGGKHEIENLRLSCAWCNRNKSSYRSIYDVSGMAIIARPNRYNIFSLPQHFWTVRTITSVRRCEHPDGCDKNVSNSELSVEPINTAGVATPPNLRVVCWDHHFLKGKRLLPRRIVADVWGKAISED